MVPMEALLMLSIDYLSIDDHAKFLSCTTSRGRQWVRQTGHSSLISKVLTMQDQQKVCPHLVALLSRNQSQQILHSPFSFPFAASDPCFSFTISLPLASSSFPAYLLVIKAYKLFPILTANVASSKQPSTLQLTSLIWSFLQVQAQLMPRRVSMKVKCLFQSSIYTIRISHSTLLIISYALPNTRTSPTLARSHEEITPCMRAKGGGFWGPGLFSSKARRCPVVSLEKSGRRRLRESSSRRKSSTLVFLFSSTPYSRQCFYLYMAMQVYSSPNLRRQRRRVTILQYASGRAVTICESNLDCFRYLLAEEGRVSARARTKLWVNLSRSLDYSSWSRRTSGL